MAEETKRRRIEYVDVAFFLSKITVQFELVIAPSYRYTSTVFRFWLFAQRLPFLVCIFFYFEKGSHAPSLPWDLT